MHSFCLNLQKNPLSVFQGLQSFIHVFSQPHLKSCASINCLYIPSQLMFCYAEFNQRDNKSGTSETHDPPRPTHTYVGYNQATVLATIMSHMH